MEVDIEIQRLKETVNHLDLAREDLNGTEHKRLQEMLYKVIDYLHEEIAYLMGG